MKMEAASCTDQYKRRHIVDHRKFMPNVLPFLVRSIQILRSQIAGVYRNFELEVPEGEENVKG